MVAFDPMNFRLDKSFEDDDGVWISTIYHHDGELNGTIGYVNFNTHSEQVYIVTRFGALIAIDDLSDFHYNDMSDEFEYPTRTVYRMIRKHWDDLLRVPQPPDG